LFRGEAELSGWESFRLICPGLERRCLIQQPEIQESGVYRMNNTLVLQAETQSIGSKQEL